MDRVLRPLAAYAAAYIDDVVFYSGMWEQHMRQVVAVLQSLRQAGQGHHDTQLGGAGDRTSNLEVTSQPALPPELMPPHGICDVWPAGGSRGGLGAHRISWGDWT